MSLTISTNALSRASGLVHIVECQDARSGIIAALICEVNRHATTGTASVLEKFIHQGFDLVEREVAVIALEEGTDASAADVAPERECAGDGLAHESADGHGDGAANADDMLACAVGCAAW